MKLSSSAVPFLFLISSNSPTFSTARGQARASTLMRLSPMALQSNRHPLRRDLWEDSRIFFSRFPPLSLGIETAGCVMPLMWNATPFPPKNPIISPLTLTTNPVCLYKYTKESVLAQRTTTCLESLSYLASLLHLGVSLKSKLPLTLMLTVFWTSLRRTRPPENLTVSLSLTTRDVSPRRRLIAW